MIWRNREIKVGFACNWLKVGADTLGGSVETKELKEDEELYLKIESLSWVNNLDSFSCTQQRTLFICSSK